MVNFFQRLFGAKPITIVSGLPRSGTSLMMSMLQAGGISPLSDELRAADADNPRGYYEFERVKQLEKGDVDWLLQARGKAVKVISALLQHLPTDHTYRIIFMERSMVEVLASQRRMLARRHEEEGNDAPDDTQMADLFEQHLHEIRDWLITQPNMSVLFMHYNEILADPESAVAQVNRFLDGELDVTAMARVVDPALYRNREDDAET